jgi:hypothetical protein
MKHRWVSGSLFFVLVTAGSLLSWYMRGAKSPPEAVWVSSTVLEPNTRISQRHLKKPDFPTPAAAWNLPEESTLEGKYTTSQIPKGARLSADNLSSLPHIAEEKEQVLLFYDTTGLGSAAAHLNSGAKVYVCDVDKPCEGGPYRVEAVLGKPDSYMVVIRVANTRADSLRKLSKPYLRLAALP